MHFQKHHLSLLIPSLQILILKLRKITLKLIRQSQYSSSKRTLDKYIYAQMLNGIFTISVLKNP